MALFWNSVILFNFKESSRLGKFNVNNQRKRTLPDIKAYFKSIVIKRKTSVVLLKEQENGPMEWNRELGDCSWIAENLASGKGGPSNL